MTLRTYNKAECVVFAKTKAKWGELSNINNTFPISIGSLITASSENLYQALKFPHRPDIQKKILEEKRPMGSKFIAVEHSEDVIPDWFTVQRVRAMKLALQMKLNQHFDRLSAILLESAQRPIVEYSKSDIFWGAVSTDDGMLQGNNYLGRLWMDYRSKITLSSTEWALDLSFLMPGELLLLEQDLFELLNHHDPNIV